MAARYKTDKAMTDTFTQNTFLEVAKQHEEWLASGGSEGRRAHFRGANLADIQFGSADLREANFRGCGLMGCDLRNVLMDGADFSDCDLRYANFTQASCHRANFSRANLEGAYFNKAQAVEVIFQQASCVSLDARNANMASVNMREANIESANFSQSTLAGANMRSVHARDTLLNETDMSHADCNDAVFISADFTDAILNQANFRRAEFTNVSFDQTDFTVSLHMDPNILTQTAIQTQKHIEEERHNLQELRETIDKGRQTIEAERSKNKQLEQQLKEMWEHENKLNHELAENAQVLYYVAGAGVALAVATIVVGIYTGWIQQWNLIPFPLNAIIFALWLGLVMVSVCAGIMIYRASSMMVRHLHEKSVPVNEEQSEQPVNHSASQGVNPNFVGNDGKVEYF